jgi:hypothetical protein
LLFVLQKLRLKLVELMLGEELVGIGLGLGMEIRHTVTKLGNLPKRQDLDVAEYYQKPWAHGN